MPNNIQEVQKRAKSLSIISTGIILYLVAGGNFKDEGTFLGGSIKFDHPEILEYAVVVIFFYFLFRYYLANKGNVASFKKKLLKRLAGRKEFKRYADDLADKYIKKLLADETKIGNRTWYKEKEAFYPEGKFRKDMGDHALLYSFLSPKIKISAIRQDNRQRLEDYTIDARALRFNYLLIKGFRDFLRYHEDFWDTVFPYVLAYGTILGIAIEIIYRFLH